MHQVTRSDRVLFLIVMVPPSNFPQLYWKPNFRYRIQVSLDFRGPEYTFIQCFLGDFSRLPCFPARAPHPVDCILGLTENVRYY
jgi:hypothetical protein